MAKIHAFGTTFTWNSVSIAGLTAINGVDVAVDQTDVTSHLSTDSYDEVVMGVLRSSEITIEGFYDYADTTGQIAMATDMNAKTSRTWTITFPTASGSTWTGTGYVVGFSVGPAGIDGAIPFVARIKPTGKPTFGYTASTGMSACTITTATIYPTFAIGTYTYTATTTGATFTVTPTAGSHTITVTANGASQTVTSGAASSAISAGSTNTVTTVVVSVVETNKSPKVYTFYVTKTA